MATPGSRSSAGARRPIARSSAAPGHPLCAPPPYTAGMPQIGPMEIMVVAIIALVVFGPEKLPELARTLGRYASELRRVAGDVRSEFDLGFEDEVQDEKPAPKRNKPLPTRSDSPNAGSERYAPSGPGSAEASPGAEAPGSTDAPLARGIDPSPGASGNGRTTADPEA